MASMELSHWILEGMLGACVATGQHMRSVYRTDCKVQFSPQLRVHIKQKNQKSRKQQTTKWKKKVIFSDFFLSLYVRDCQLSAS